AAVDPLPADVQLRRHIRQQLLLRDHSPILSPLPRSRLRESTHFRAKNPRFRNKVRTFAEGQREGRTAAPAEARSTRACAPVTGSTAATRSSSTVTRRPAARARTG